MTSHFTPIFYIFYIHDQRKDAETNNLWRMQREKMVFGNLSPTALACIDHFLDNVMSLDP